MRRILPLALGLFVVMFVAGIVNAALITAAPESLRSPWLVLGSTGLIVLIAGRVFWKATARRRS
jgi:hypothetical protein